MEGALEVSLRSLTGQELRLSVAEDILGSELLQLVRSRLPPKPGAVLRLNFGELELVPERSLRDQATGSGNSLPLSEKRGNKEKNTGLGYVV